MIWLITFMVLLNGLESSADNYIGNIDLGGGSWFDSGSSDNQLQQVVTSDYNYIGSGTSYAVSASTLKQFNWASVSVNGDRVKIFTPDCNVIEKNMSEIGQDERRQLDSIVSSRDFVPSTISINNHVSFKTTAQNLGGIRSGTYGDYSLQQVGKYHSVSSASLKAADIKQLFFDDQLVTVYHTDGSILMQPKACLDSPKQKLISNVESELAEAEAKWEGEFEAQQAERKKEQEARQAEMQKMIANQQAELQAQLKAQAAEREANRREREIERERQLAEREAERQERERERQEMLAQRERERQERVAERERERAQRDAERLDRQRNRQQNRYY